MAINKINQLAISAVFTPTTGAVSAGDNAQLALEKLQGSKANGESFDFILVAAGIVQIV